MNSILVTGALGNVGGEIVRQMLDQGIAIRAADIDPRALISRYGKNIEIIEFDFARPDTYKPALKSVKKIFLMRPPHISDVKRLILPFIETARSAGVEQVVFLSLIGIEKNPQVPHYKVEQYLQSSGMAYTFLRASFFMQNLSGIHVEEIRDRNEIFVPVGHGKTSFVDVRDIAAVAVKTLAERGHGNQAYDLTGPEALNYFQVADIFSKLLGREIIYRNPSIIAFILKSLRRGKPLSLTLIMSYLYTQTKRGMSAQVTQDVEKILGRSPILLEQFVTDYQHVWVKS